MSYPSREELLALELPEGWYWESGRMEAVLNRSFRQFHICWTSGLHSAGLGYWPYDEGWMVFPGRMAPGQSVWPTLAEACASIETDTWQRQSDPLDDEWMTASKKMLDALAELPENSLVPPDVLAEFQAAIADIARRREERGF